MTGQGRLPRLAADTRRVRYQYAEQAPAPQVEGDAALWDGLIGALDRFTFWFPVVTSPDAPLPPPA